MIEFENVVDYLPDSVHEIIDIIGFASTEKLVQKLGGISFKFSEGKLYYPKLKEVLGDEKAKKLCDYFGGGECYIPRCSVALRKLRAQRLYADFCYLTQQEGKSGRMAMLEICPKYNISDRYAWQTIYSLQNEENRSQSQLF
ncbi:Mor transcription activator family protein [Pasteurella skyensis]|uniref:Mor transcription activator family protein n=1 Tax=Phocoenobacter skyensis TaxID=97481 RepID=A0AAJ6NEQ6_9PAST|nr:Mor transcription activator family protein [Pasteurella skyensis]MDP8171531.1 Mor transcription activator family protein [Pasteurella skyensis]MDP8175433.1 Mor transcription activator family protein [Pasteurella skyensis]